jgi:hypothetical protein
MPVGRDSSSPQQHLADPSLPDVSTRLPILESPAAVRGDPKNRIPEDCSCGRTSQSAVVRPPGSVDGFKGRENTLEAHGAEQCNADWCKAGK